MTTTKLQNFNIEIHCIVIGTNLQENKQYIVSTNENEIVFPSFYLNHENKSDIQNEVVKFLQSNIESHAIELIPQLITLNDDCLKDKKKNSIHTVYSSLITYTNDINNLYWIEFDFLQPNRYSNLIFEVIHKLK